MNHNSTRMPHVALAATIWFEQALDTAMPIARNSAPYRNTPM